MPLPLNQHAAECIVCLCSPHDTVPLPLLHLAGRAEAKGFELKGMRIEEVLGAART